NKETFSFIIIAPQLVKMITNSEVQQLIDYVKANYRVDVSRIYLSGFSLGARILSNYASSKPSAIAAITAMGGAIQIDTNLHKKSEAMASANLPVWQFHNRDDSAWYYSEAQRFYEVLCSFPSDVVPKFTTFEVGEARLHHDCWTRTTDPSYKEEGKNI